MSSGHGRLVVVLSEKDSKCALRPVLQDCGFFPLHLVVTSVNACCPHKVAAVVSETGTCGCTGPASELSFSGTTELLRPRGLCCFSGLLVNLLSPLPLGPSAHSSSLGTASVGAAFSAHVFKGVALGLGSIYVAGT